MKVAKNARKPKVVVNLDKNVAVEAGVNLAAEVPVVAAPSVGLFRSALNAASNLFARAKNAFTRTAPAVQDAAPVAAAVEAAPAEVAAPAAAEGRMSRAFKFMKRNGLKIAGGLVAAAVVGVAAVKAKEAYVASKDRAEDETVKRALEVQTDEERLTFANKLQDRQNQGGCDAFNSKPHADTRGWTHPEKVAYDKGFNGDRAYGADHAYEAYRPVMR